MKNHLAAGKGDIVFFKHSTNKDLYQNSLKTLVSHKPTFVKPGYDSMVDTFNSKSLAGVSF
jgi:hypothetical protein